MIVLPRRSVTRFFIPMIDVLTLLFCIFLLLPILQEQESPGSAAVPAATGPEATLEPTPEELARQLQVECKELEALRKERVAVLQGRLAVHTLQIDANTGKLFDLQGKEIAAQADAVSMIDRDRKAAPGKDLFYTILYPRRGIGFPSNRQVQRYDEWFREAAHEFDVPPDAE